MEDQLLSMAASSHCVGWRKHAVAHWTEALGQSDLYKLGTSLTNITARDYYHARVQHRLPAGKTTTSYDTFAEKNPAGAEACEKKAKELQAAHGGLYIGMTDCIRSVMCDRDGGLAALGWACHACYTLH